MLCERPPQYAPASCDLDLLTLKMASESRVTWATCASFILPRPLCSQFRPDVCDRQTDRQTDVRQHHRLMPPPRGRGIIILDEQQCRVEGAMCPSVQWLATTLNAIICMYFLRG